MFTILYDLFPSHLLVVPAGFTTDVHTLQSHPPTSGGYYLQTNRIIVSDTHITVATDSPEGPSIIFNERYVSFEKSASQNTDSYVVTESGKMLVFKKDTNCGCGSRLRSWNPYRTLGSINDPTS
jgi:hypothetical protein